VSTTGTDAFAQPAPDADRGIDPLLAGVRRLTLLADGAGDEEAIFRGLARELLLTPGADEVHIHRLAGAPAEEEPVVVYLFEGDGRLSYLSPLAARPAGISWVASTARPFLAADPNELAASLPRLSQTGEAACALLLPLLIAGQVEAVVVLVRRSEGGRAEGAFERSGSAAGSGSAGAYTEPAIELASTLVEQAGTVLALVYARAEAGTDPVTGCLNHRAMRRRLQEEIGRAMRTGGLLSCLLIDLDNFKLVNDRHGHPAGDAVLREVCHALAGEVRAFDRVARYGGDEFVVILPNADLDAAAAAAGRILQRLGDLSAHEGLPAVGASIGAAQWQPPMSTDALLQACDTALLRSKREGKGRVVRAS
jgi:diguanylate cyclase (GGDEF)-like protein